jgi:hypothetical protein
LLPTRISLSIFPIIVDEAYAKQLASPVLFSQPKDARLASFTDSSTDQKNRNGKVYFQGSMSITQENSAQPRTFTGTITWHRNAKLTQ